MQQSDWLYIEYYACQGTARYHIYLDLFRIIFNQMKDKLDIDFLHVVKTSSGEIGVSQYNKYYWI